MFDNLCWMYDFSYMSILIIHLCKSVRITYITHKRKQRDAIILQILLLEITIHDWCLILFILSACRKCLFFFIKLVMLRNFIKLLFVSTIVLEVGFQTSEFAVRVTAGIFHSVLHSYFTIHKQSILRCSELGNAGHELFEVKEIITK